MNLISKPSFQILTTPGQVAAYVDRVIDLADANRQSFGFLQKSVFREQANRGRLWIAASQSNECLGYLLFGGRYPSLRVFQLFVKKTHRKVGVGRKLIGSLITWGEKFNYLTISARVAADLHANTFWETVGFSLVRQENGGKSSGRMINIRARELNTPSLFNMISGETLGSKVGIEHVHLYNRPIVGVQTYVLDLNIFFDIIKKRVHRAEAARLLSAGLSQEARVIVTPEFLKELERNTPRDKPDPVLEFARTLPVLPEIPTAEIDKLLPELEAMVFPEGIPHGRQKAQTVSDLVHLAYCIHHRITGFITREKPILEASDQLQETYSLEVLSPADLIPPTEPLTRDGGPIHARLGTESVTVSAATETERGEVERFLFSRGVDPEGLATIWHPGTISSPRRRITARTGADLIAVASWDGPASLSTPKVLHLYVDEISPCAETIIDHVLELALRDMQPLTVRLVALGAPIDQTKARSTAAKRGFIRTFPNALHSPLGQLNKLVFNGLISPENWGVFSKEVEKIAGLRLPIRIPTFEEFSHTGIIIKNHLDAFVCSLKLFDFETLVSPGVVLCPGRAAVVVPIQLRFAKGLFTYVQTQGELFPAPEALLHVEKAYFRSTAKTSIFTRGTLVLFYLSGSAGGTKEVIGCARITYSEVLPPDKIELSLERQGVLSRCDLEDLANSNGDLHVFTFDNYNPFPIRIPFNVLRSRAMISGANLITAEQLSPKHCAQVCEYGFGFRSRPDA